MSTFANVLADFVSEDPQAFEGEAWTVTTDPADLAKELIDSLEVHLEGMKVAKDPMAMRELLENLLKSYEYSPDELTEIGEAVLAKRK